MTTTGGSTSSTSSTKSWSRTTSPQRSTASSITGSRSVMSGPPSSTSWLGSPACGCGTAGTTGTKRPSPRKAAATCPFGRSRGHERQLGRAPAECATRLARTTLLVRDAGAGWTGERNDVYLPEACLLAPGGKVGAREIERVAELDQHVERHQETER